MNDTSHPNGKDANGPPCGCSVHAVTVLQTDISWNGKPYEKYPEGRPQLSVVRFSIPPHSALPWHTHPMPNAAYIIAGQITVEERATGKKQIIKAGEAFAESVDDMHRGYTEEQPAEIVCVYAGSAGLVLSVPAD